MKHITDEEYSKLGMKTALQWSKEKKLPNDNDDGVTLWCNYFHHKQATYYRPDEVHIASKEELDAFLKPYREKQRERRKKRAEQQKRLWKEELEQRYKQGVEDTTYSFQRKINEMKIACKSSVYSVIAENIVPEKIPEIKSKKIVFDVETTGLSPEMDEILQISIIDGEGNVLVNSYVRPYYTTEWNDAYKINGVTKEMVETAPFAHELMPLVQGIFASADTWIAYNHSFDIEFLKYWGVEPRENTQIVDVMLDFAPLYGDWNEYYQDFKNQKLIDCARFFDYYKFNVHDSLEDVRATLHCYNCIEKMVHDGTYQEIVQGNLDRFLGEEEDEYK